MAGFQPGDRIYSPRFGRGEVVRVDEATGALIVRLEDGREIPVRDPGALRLQRIDEERAIAPFIPADAGEEGDAGEEPTMDREEMRRLIAEALEDVLGPADAEMGDRWKGGSLVLKPGKPETQPKELPLDKFFQKIVRLRDQLRVLEQKINTHARLEDADRLVLQQYVTRCYGSLTTFNVLFKRAEDRFVGSGGGD
jgi:hypothetical protein